jgi:hypothetical protein
MPSQRTRIPFASNSYTSRSLPISAQRLVNVYPEIQPDDAKGKLPLFGCPGLDRFATLPAGPVRGLYEWKGVLYAVGGGGLYRVAGNGAATLLGAVGGDSAAARMLDNGDQLAIVSGGGVSVWDGAAMAAASIPAAALVDDMAFLDGYGVWIERSTGRFGVTALNDFTTADALDFATAESSPDGLQAVLVDHREVWLIGAKTCEIWTNTGAADFPLERLQGANIERGTAAAASAAKFDGSITWLGDDRIVYRAEGYTPKRISHHAMEAAVSGYETVSDAYAFVYAQGGHTFYVLTFPSANATWVYDAATGFWHERQSGLSGRWKVQGVASCYGKVFVGDAETGAVYALDPDTYDASGAPLIRSATSAPMHAQGKRAIAHRVELDFDTGRGRTTGQGEDPQAMLQWSDDGGRTWSSERWVSMGRIGEYRRRAVWTRLGSFRERVWRVTVSDPAPFVLIAANIDIEGLAS